MSTKVSTKQQLNVRASDATRTKLDDLTAIYGTQAEVVAVAVDRLWLSHNRKETTMNIRRDSNAKEVSKEQIIALLESGVAGTISSRPGYHVKTGDEVASVFGTGAYYVGSEDEDGGLVLTAQDEPGDWLCWLVEELDVAVYGPGMRVVDFTWHLVPLHDSHARFARAVCEMTARVERTSIMKGNLYTELRSVNGANDQYTVTLENVDVEPYPVDDLRLEHRGGKALVGGSWRSLADADEYAKKMFEEEYGQIDWQ